MEGQFTINLSPRDNEKQTGLERKLTSSEKKIKTSSVIFKATAGCVVLCYTGIAFINSLVIELIVIVAGMPGILWETCPKKRQWLPTWMR